MGLNSRLGGFAIMVAVGLSVAWLHASSQSPQSPGQRPVFRAGINIVQIDVTVLGPDGRPLHGLAAEDFVLLEDGEPREILGFGEVNVPDATDSPVWMRDSSPDVRTALDGRIFVFLLDDAQTPYLMTQGAGFVHPDEWIVTVKRILGEVIDRMGPTDIAAVICVYDKRCDQDFTSDHVRLKTAADKFDPKGAFIADRVSAGIAESISKYLRGEPSRRRTIIYVTPHLPTRPAVWPPPGAQGAGAVTAQQMIRTFEEAMRARITVYGINLMGLRSLTGESVAPDAVAGEGETSGGTPRFTAPPRSLALETGGFNISRPDQFAEGVKQIFRETGSYYLLGYEPGPKKDTGYNMLGGFRELEVRVNRPGLTVKTHRGYITSNEPKTPKNPPAESTAAMSGILPKTDLPLRVTVAPFAAPGQPEAVLAIALGIGGPAVESRTRDYIDVQIRAFTPHGDERALTRTRVDAVIAPSRAGDALTDVVSELRLKPGKYSLRLAAYSERLAVSGAVYTDVEVPDFAKAPLSLSGVLLVALPKPESVIPDPLSSLLPAVPTTRREFTRTTLVRAHLRAYQGGKLPIVPVALKTSVLDAAGIGVIDRVETLDVARFATARSTDVRVDIPVSQLAGGQHLLRIEATAGALAARRDVRFTVR